MTEQLLSELTVQGENRLNREDLWNSIKEQEIAMLRDAIQKEAAALAVVWEQEMLASLKGKAVDLALDGLVANLEAEGTSLAPGATHGKQILDKYLEGKGILGINPVPPQQIAKWQNKYVQAVRKELEVKAHAQAEREWRAWKEDKLARASGEVMRRLSIDYIIEKCGLDAEAIIAEKQAFARDYAHCNYQNWLNQVLSERWPLVEAEAQTVSRETYLNREIAAIYPEVHQEAYELARKEALTAVEAHKAKLLQQKMSAAEKDKKTGKKIRGIKVDARRTDIAEVLNKLDYDSNSDNELVNTAQIKELVVNDSNQGSDDPPNVAFKLGVAMGIIQPLEGLAPQVRPHQNYAPSPETIGEPTPSPTDRPIMVDFPEINEEVAAARSIYSSDHAPEATPPPPPPAAGNHELFALLQQFLGPLQESVDALRLQVEVIDDRTVPKPTIHFAPSTDSTSSFPPQESVDEDFLMLASPHTLPSGTTAPSKDGGLSANETQPVGRPRVPAIVPQSPAPSPPGPPSREATVGASTAVASPSPPLAGARTDTVSTTPSPPSAPSPPTLPKPKGKGKGKGASTVPEVPSPLPKGASTTTDNDGFISVTRPKLAYNIVSAKAVQQQQASKQQAATASATQQRTAVVVARHGGFADAAKEAAIQGDLPERIAASVRSAIERNTSNPIKILSGRWAKGVEKTGNYVYNITSKIPMEHILQFSKFLLQPFPGGSLIPADGWCWAQLREVLVHDDDNNMCTEETLFEELSRNPAFEGIPFVQRPHWERDIMTIDTATGTVVFAYIDPAGKVAKEAKTAGIFMFNYVVKFVFAGDSPRPKQCGRCFLIGHVTNSPKCRWNGKNCCVRCGLDHHHNDHNINCTATTHSLADRCDCVFKCLLCGKTGHNARNCKCPARGDFPPPKPAPKLFTDEEEPQPKAAQKPRSILKRPTDLPSPPDAPLARVDDEDALPIDEPSLFDADALRSEAATSAHIPPPVKAPTSRPKARIVLLDTDQAKPGETSTERAALRTQKVVASETESTPGPVTDDFPPLPTPIPNTKYDHATRVHLEDHTHQLLTEVVTGIAVVKVGTLWYRCPLNEMNIAFRHLRDTEMIILNKMRYGEELGPDDKLNFTAKYEHEARKL
ncbi:hypothetical protein EDB85DRAFT_2150724 [Lactarius pseudohatsudake]|nr:hypothetical protein EDB85DRAFT_2150724 [Lactarius pseudohatsudake]